MRCIVCDLVTEDINYKFFVNLEFQFTVGDEIWLFIYEDYICNIPLSQKKKKKKSNGQIFWNYMCPPNTLTPTTHLTHWLLFSWPAIPFFLFSFLSFLFSHTLLVITCSSSPTGTSIPPSPNHFSSNITRKSLRTSKHFYLLFEAKVSNIFGGFIFFCLRLFLSKL